MYKLQITLLTTHVQSRIIKFYNKTDNLQKF